MTGLVAAPKSLAAATWASVGAIYRGGRLWLARRVGDTQRTLSAKWRPFLIWLVLVAAALGGPYAVVKLAEEWGLWSWLGLAKPDVPNFLSVQSVIGVFLALLFLRWFTRARERMVVDEFVDFTSEDAKAVSGLATLLVTELSRLRDLYHNVNDELSVPITVGVHEQGASAGQDHEPGSFLTVRADDVGEVLNGAVASESKLSVGPLLIPVGTVFALLGRVARGPRILGSVHRTKAGGGPTLTAQIVGGAGSFTWRVDGSELVARSDQESKAFLDRMIAELAVRMFTDLTLHSSARWRAIREFSEYLRLYRGSLRTPKNRALFLKQAENRLLEAVAEDESFDLAYYNLGVIYSQLAQAEITSAQLSEVEPKDFKPWDIHKARMHAATVAFRKAIELNPNRWEAHYALAVHQHALVKVPEAETERAGADKSQHLREVVRLCERVVAMNPDNAEAYDLLGLAQLEQDRHREAITSHRRAVALSWRLLCRAERAERASSASGYRIVPRIQANTTAALHNLAVAYARKATEGEGDSRAQAEICTRQSLGPRRPELLLKWWLGLRRAHLLFRQALYLAPAGSAAASHYELGRVHKWRGRWRAAADAFDAATRREPENPIYWAGLASAAARAARTDPARKDQATIACRRALETMAPIWRWALSPQWTTGARKTVDDVLDALQAAHRELGNDEEPRRIARMRALKDDIVRLQREIDEQTRADPGSRGPAVDRGIAQLEGWFQEYRDQAPGWEAEQIGIVLGRLYAERERWRDAERLHIGLIEVLAVRPEAVVAQHLYIRLAAARRHQGEERLRDAIEAADEGLLRDPLSYRGRYEMGEIYFSLRQFDEAIEAWDHSRWLKPNDPYLHWKVGLAHWCNAQEHHDANRRSAALGRAGEYFEKARLLFGIEEVVGRTWMHYWIGRLRLDVADYDQAIRHLRTATGLQASALAARLFLAEAYRRAGDHWLAGREFERACKELAAHADPEPDEPGSTMVDREWGDMLSISEARAVAALGRAYMLAERPETLCKAAEAAHSARVHVDAIPDELARARVEARVLDCEGWILFRQGEVVSALGRIRDAVAIHPTVDAYVHEARLLEHLASASVEHLERHEHMVAVKECRRGIKRLAGDGDLIREAEEALERLMAHDASPAGNGVTARKPADAPPGGDGPAPQPVEGAGEPSPNRSAAPMPPTGPAASRTL